LPDHDDRQPTNRAIGMAHEMEDRSRAAAGRAARRRQKQIQTIVIRLISLTVVLSLWRSRAAQVDPVLFTHAPKIAVAAVGMIGSGELWTYLWPSLVVLMIGLTLRR